MLAERLSDLAEILGQTAALGIRKIALLDLLTEPARELLEIVGNHDNSVVVFEILVKSNTFIEESFNSQEMLAAAVLAAATRLEKMIFQKNHVLSSFAHVEARVENGKNIVGLINTANTILAGLDRSRAQRTAASTLTVKSAISFFRFNLFFFLFSFLDFFS